MLLFKRIQFYELEFRFIIIRNGFIIICLEIKRLICINYN